MEKAFAKQMTSLDGVFEFLDQYMTRQGIDAATAYSVNLAVEEFFTNMVKYSGGRRDDVLISIASDGRLLTVRLVDRDTDPFDITGARTGHVDDLTRPLHERRVGGLGIHLAKEMVDSLSYEHANRQSTITFTMNLEK